MTPPPLLPHQGFENSTRDTMPGSFSFAAQICGQVEEAEIEKFITEHPPSPNDLTRRDIKVKF